MTIVDSILADDEIRDLKKQLYDITGERLGFNYDCYLGVEDYKAHLRDCIRAGKIVIRPQEEAAMHRFDAVFQKDKSTRQK